MELALLEGDCENTQGKAFPSSGVTWGLMGWVFIQMLFFPKGIHHFQSGFILVL